jgi:hypothetical protein
MPANYVLLQKIVVGATSAASVTFSNIPQTGYTDLQIMMSPHTDRASYANADLALQFNGSSVSNGKAIYSANTNTVISGSLIALVQGGNNSLTGDQNLVFGPTSLYIPNYTGSTNKSVSIEFTAEGNSTDIEQTRNGMSSLLWTNTSAINSITLSPNSGTNWTQNSTFYLYGIAKAGVVPTVAPYATGGDTISSDGTYFIHTFRTSGTFTPKKAISNVDYLVIAGGGGGGQTAFGGGGGAGGLRSTVTATGGGGSLESKLSLASGTGYTVTVGAGGAASTTGSNSVFSTITSNGGGGGGYYFNVDAKTGGSGGGGSGGDGTKAGAAGTANQGYAGGSGNDGAPSYTARVGGGGGGAGAVGGSAVANVSGGAGGAGVASSISGSSVTYAGGGGGSDQANASSGPGAGGAGGGGGGGDGTTPGVAGTANTGGGGGGAGNGAGSAGGAGGSGLVIVRYPI